MFQDKEEENLKRLQQVVPTATPETVKVYADCMKSDAVFKSALPYAAISGVIWTTVLPRKLGIIRHVSGFIVSTMMYVYGKIIYAPVCYQRAFGSSLKETEITRRNWPSNAFNRPDSLEQKNKHITSSVDSFVHEDLMDNTDFQFDSTANEFSSDFQQMNIYQEEEATEQPKQEKKRVTYDDLWMQHRNEQMKLYSSRTRQVPSQWKKPVDDQEAFDEEKDDKHF